ncbi:MAG TPA: Co2+/Mg2+ efflux protein ApaG [Anaeromyxobacteraceae bacterium]|nr:Co2+/Mg2+ efflux protein ApaG [Anaeromyxobacteraceae bacterium]
MSTALTDGIRVQVDATYLPDRSEPQAHRWLFTYTVTVRNEGSAPAQLVSRHWVIADAEGTREDVEGEGVVGHQPRLEPGEGFRYSSFCVLKTSHGSMRGSYRMVRDDGAAFDAVIAPFPLVIPQLVN